MLLVRARMPIEPAVRHLVGLQAQRPDPPHIGLWSRLSGIRHADIDDLIDRRRLLRVAAMRSTIHLLTAEDALGLRPVIQPALDRELSAPVFKSLRRVKVNAVVARGRELCREQPLTFAALGEALAREFPAGDPHALAIAVRNHVALAQVPPRGRWRTAAPTVHVPVADWLGSPVATDPDPAPLVLRYLAAFGPATAADIATWSGLRGIKVLLERMRDRAVLADRRSRPHPGRRPGRHPARPRRAGAGPVAARIRQRAALARRPDQDHRGRRPAVRLHPQRPRRRHGAGGRLRPGDLAHRCSNATPRR